VVGLLFFLQAQRNEEAKTANEYCIFATVNEW